jgi:PAS domain S-box-containing protein
MMPTGLEISEWIRDSLFDAVPLAISFVDQAFNLVHANRAFENTFGPWRNRKCYSVYRNRGAVCPDCKGIMAFSDGKVHVGEEVGVNRDGKPVRFIKQTLPVVDRDGDIPFLVEMCMDVTEIDRIKREHQLLFDQVPCQILIIDRDFKVVKTNARMRSMIGDLEGHHCYRKLKGADHICSECTARQTFEDGGLHTGYHVWRTKDGKAVQLHVITVPLRLGDDGFDMVLEMAVDVTRTLDLMEGLNYAHTFLETLVDSSMDGILALNPEGRISLINPAARRLLGVKDDQILTRNSLADLLPPDVVEKLKAARPSVCVEETMLRRFSGGEVPVRLVGNLMNVENEAKGMAFFLQDLSGIRKLQNEKLEAERLAAVGQTVAGLAHGMKNLITALEGGMYMLNSGIRKADIGRLEQGVDTLSRNIERMSTFVKDFLGFSKGLHIRRGLVDPAALVGEAVEIISEKAFALGVAITCDFSENMEKVPLDAELLRQCLGNLLENSLDACLARDDTGGARIIVACFEMNDELRIDVTDNGCGMEKETRAKIFSTFFTTKGLEGTGLGLLMSKRIIQEHGGSIEVVSQWGKGTEVHIRIPMKTPPDLSSMG